MSLSKVLLRMYQILILACYFLRFVPVEGTSLRIALFLNGNSSGSYKAENAASIAARQINRNLLFSQNITLEIIPIRVDECASLQTITKLLEFQKCSSKASNEYCGIFAITSACPVTSETIALLTRRLNIIQIDNMPLQPSAVIRLKDGNYFSLTPTMDMLLRAQMAVIRRIGATRIAALIGVEPACSESWKLIKSEMNAVLDNSVIKTFYLTDEFNITRTISELKDQHISSTILTCVQDHMLRYLSYQAAEQGLIYPSVLWVLPTAFSNLWDMNATQSPSNQFRLFLNRAITVSPTYHGGAHSVEIPDEIVQSSLSEKLVYDATWITGLTLNSSLQQPPSPERIQLIANLKEIVNSIDFVGASGFVHFNSSSGQRSNKGAAATIHQLHPNGSISIEQFATVLYTDTTPRAVLLKELDEVLPDGLPKPAVKLPIWKRVPLPDHFVALYIVMLTFIVLGILYAVSFIIFSVVCRNHRDIKLTSPRLNITLAIGAILWYISIALAFPPWSSEPWSITLRCELHKWILGFGSTLLFIPLLLKTWRVYYIFHNPLQKKVAMQDWKLLIALGVFLVVDVVCLSITTAIDATRLKGVIMEQGNEIWIMCGTFQGNLISFLIFALVKSIWCIIGLLLAFQTRKIRLKGIRESRNVALASYIFAVSLVVIVVTSQLTHSKYLLQLLILGTTLHVTATSILTVMFIPKVYMFVKQGKETEDDTMTSWSTVEDVESLRKTTLAAMQNQITQLGQQLEESRKTNRRLTVKVSSINRGNNAVNGNSQSEELSMCSNSHAHSHDTNSHDSVQLQVALGSSSHASQDTDSMQ